MKMKCKKCGSIIESKYGYDFNYQCDCLSTLLDNGNNYPKVDGKPDSVEPIEENKQEKTASATMFICIEDNGGRNSTCPDMSYHLPQQYLICSDILLTDEQIQQLINVLQKTRRGVRLVGVFFDSLKEEYDYNGKAVINYKSLNI